MLCNIDFCKDTLVSDNTNLYVNESYKEDSNSDDDFNYEIDEIPKCAVNNNDMFYKKKLKVMYNNHDLSIKKNEKLSITDTSSINGDYGINISILNPKILFSVLNSYLINKRRVILSKSKDINSNTLINNCYKNSDWYVIGVIIFKSEVKIDKNNKKYAFWILRDINEDPLASGFSDIMFFLFGEAFMKLWKLNIGTTLAILNPDINKNQSLELKYSRKETFFIRDTKKVLEIGEAKDLVLCAGSCAGSNFKNNKSILRVENCTEYINKLSGSKFCVKHLQYELKKNVNKRMELNPTYGSNSRPLTTTLISKSKLGLKEQYINFNEKQNYQSRISLNKSPCKTIGKTLDKLMSFHESNFVQPTPYATENLISNKRKSSSIDLKQKNNKILQQNKISSLRQNCQFDYLNSSNTKADSIKHFSKLFTPKLGKGFNDHNSITLSLNKKIEDFDPIIRAPIINYGDTTSQYLKVLKNISLKPIPINPNSIKPTINAKYISDISKKIKSHGTCANNKQQSPSITESTVNKAKLEYILNKKSNNIHLLEAHNVEQEKRYFNELENKEAVTTNLEKVMEVKCTVVSCIKCKYSYWSASENCKATHRDCLIYKKGVKKFYQCKDCKSKTQTFLNLPDKSCNNCHSYNYIRIPMYKSYDDGILQPSEKLLIRGEDHAKFLNSVS
ncbi:unnamed protein product [Gordionus sp. m RMFG-2023]